MDRPTIGLKASATGAFLALLALSGCGGTTAGNQSSGNDVNAAAIAVDAARASANEMHNQMDDQHRDGGPANAQMMNEHHGRAMGGTGGNPGMNPGNMPATGGHNMSNMPAAGGSTTSNQAMPMEKEDHM
jgi:hypothetical protein